MQLEIKIEGLTELEIVVRSLSANGFIERALVQSLAALDADVAERQRDIATQTPYSQSYVGRRKPKSGKIVTQGIDFGIDSGDFFGGWLRDREVRGGEILRYSNLKYATYQQAIYQRKSPFSDGLLGYSEDAIEAIERQIYDEADKEWTSKS